MTEQEIKDRAPDGATHYLELGRYTDGSGYLIAYYMLFNSVLFLYECNQWMESEYKKHQMIQLNIKPL